jgi:selenocysteine lyase/cysteine desulfurase
MNGGRSVVRPRLANGATAVDEWDPGSWDPGSWDSVRAQFALRRDVAYLAGFMLSTHPAPVRRAIERYRERLDFDPDYVPTAGTGIDADTMVRRAAADYLGRGPGEVALTDCTTTGLAIVYSGLRLRPGQDVVTTAHDHPSATHEALRLLAERYGTTARRVRLYDDPAAASVDRIVGSLRAALGPGTRLVTVAWVHPSTGVRVPVRAIADMLAEVNRDRDEPDRVLLCVDGAQGFGALADRPDDLGCDFLAAGLHKWLFGPRGTGILWGRAWAALSPIIPSFSRFSREALRTGRPPVDPTAEFWTPGGYKAYEHRWAMADAFAFHQRIGLDRVQARTTELAGRLKAGLKEIRGVRLATPESTELSAGIVSCSVAGMAPREAYLRLRDEHGVVATTTPFHEPLLRFGTTIINTPDEVDRAVRAVAALR